MTPDEAPDSWALQGLKLWHPGIAFSFFLGSPTTWAGLAQRITAPNPRMLQTTLLRLNCKTQA